MLRSAAAWACAFGSTSTTAARALGGLVSAAVGSRSTGSSSAAPAAPAPAAPAPAHSVVSCCPHQPWPGLRHHLCHHSSSSSNNPPKHTWRPCASTTQQQPPHQCLPLQQATSAFVAQLPQLAQEQRQQQMQPRWQQLQHRHFHKQQSARDSRQHSSSSSTLPPDHSQPPTGRDSSSSSSSRSSSFAAPPTPAAAGAGERVPGSAFTTLPNMLSLSRVATSPWLAYAITAQEWHVAVALTAAAGASDWLDGYLARRLGHTSKLGSYLDPLADKVFVATAVGTMGVLGMVPAWLAVLVVGRDSAQVAGMFVYRLRMFGGAWPDAAAFFDVDHAVRPRQPQQQQQEEEEEKQEQRSGGVSSSSSSSSSSDATGQQHLPMIRPLLISKANTALVMALVGGCMAHQWQGVPDAGVLQSLELATAGTTLASAAAYAWLHWQGRLLAPADGKGTSGTQRPE